MSDVRIIVRGLSKRYRRGPDHPQHAGIGAALLRPYRRLRGLPVAPPRPNASEFWALQDVTFDVHDGERIGIIGRNGAGKSTLLKILSRIIYPTEGEARIRGRVTSLLEVGTGFNQGLSGRENIYLNASVHGLERKEIDARFDEIVEFSGIREFIDTPVKHYSSGMYMRLAFSVAAHLDPDILLLDEVLAVGDISFQQKCLRRVEGLTSEGRTVLFVSHSMDAIARFCSRCIWLERGKIVVDGPTHEVIEAYVKEVLQTTSSSKWVSAYSQSQQESDGNQVRTTTASEEPPSGEMAESKSAKHPLHEPSRSRSNAALAANLFSPKPVVGSDDVRPISARIVNETGLPASAIPMDERVGIELNYEVLKTGKPLVPAVALIASDERVIFWAVDTDPTHMEERKAPGLYSSIAWLPRHFLNAGQYFVTVAVVTPDPMERHFTLEKALSFYSLEVVDHRTAARGPMARNFPGVIRPKLDWQPHLLDTDGAT